MKLIKRLCLGLLLLVGLSLLTLALILSHEGDCKSPPEVTAGSQRMQAINYGCYGSPEVLRLVEAEKPAPKEDEVLVKVHAAGVNPLDWHYMRGSPYFMRLSSGLGTPTDSSLGVDFAGTVESVGAEVTEFEPGQAVFGGASGAFGEYVTVRESRAISHIPANTSFEEAAALPVAAISAMQALRDKGQLKPGQKVLINGASGGVGTYAVQIAKAWGAEVHGVCSTRNLELVRSLGADRVIDYTRENYTQGAEQYDLIIDNVGNHSLLANRRVMSDDATLVLVGGSSGNWLGPMVNPVLAMLLSPLVSQNFVVLLAGLDGADLDTLGDLMASGQLRSVIDRRFSLEEVPQAIAYSETGRARGKIIVTVD